MPRIAKGGGHCGVDAAAGGRDDTGMQYRTIAQGKLQVSTVCLGCWAMVGDDTWGPQDKADAIDTIRAAVDAGITFFDTAEGYGAGYSEQLIGEALGRRRDEVVIASKVSRSHLSAGDLAAACERSLQNLGTAWLDVYYIHWPSRQVPLTETVRAMEDLVAAGKVRHMAVSNFGRADLSEILPLAAPAANQLAYSLLFRAIELEVLPACRAADVAVTCYSPLMQGLLTGKFPTPEDVPEGRARTRHFSGSRPQARHGQAGAEQETFAVVAGAAEVARQGGLDMAAMSLAWLLGREGVASVVVGARSPEQIRRNAAAAGLALPRELAERLDEISRPLREKLGASADMWSAESRLR